MRGVEHSEHVAKPPEDPELLKHYHRAELDKSRTLRRVEPMVAAGALPQPGVSLNFQDDVTQDQLAAMAGYSCRSSYTRDFKRMIPIVRKKSTFAGANHYDWNLGPGDAAFSGNSYRPPKPSTLREHRKLGRYWPKGSCQYYDPRAGWVWHRRSLGTPNQKLVLSYLEAKGLFRQGYLEDTTQIEIARAKGLSIDCVRACLRHYSIWQDQNGKSHKGKVPMLRLVHVKGHWEKDGAEVPAGTPGSRWIQPPNKIIVRSEFTYEMALSETQRLLMAADQRNLRAQAWWNHVARIHAELLKEWIGTEKRLVTLLKECRKLAAEIGVPAHSIHYLFSDPPD